MKIGMPNRYMDDFLLRFLRGDLEQVEEQQVAAWIAESPENEKRLEELRTVLSLARVRDERTDPGAPPSASEIIFRAGLMAGKKPKPVRRPWSPRILAPLAVAAAAVCVALGVLGYRAFGGIGTSRSLVAEEFSTSAGESTTVRMNDGSVVHLGPESRLQIMAADASRQVVLEGQAFFAVAHDASRPFRVFTPAGSVRVLGTRFELRADVSDLRLVVVEGRVVVATRDAEVQVNTGEMTEVSGGRASGVVHAPGMGALSDEWMGQFLVFQETSLAKAAEEIGEVYGVEVRVLDPALSEKTLTMWFSSRPLEGVLAVACSVIDAPCRIDEGVVTIGVGREGTQDSAGDP